MRREAITNRTLRATPANKRSGVKDAASRWRLFPYLLAVLLLVTGVSLFHVWSRVRVVELSLEVAQGQKQLKDVQQENNRLKLEVASLKTPGRIEALARGELGMQLPTDNQMVVVK